MDVKRAWIAAMMMSLTAAAVICMGISCSGTGEAAPVTVRLLRVRQGDVEQVIGLSGVVRYEGEYAAVSATAGLVEQVCVAPGDRVRAGELLVRLRADAQHAAVAAALRSLDERETAVSDALAAAGRDMQALPGREAALTEASASLEATALRASADGRVLHVATTVNSALLPGDAPVLLCTGPQQIVCNAVLADAQRIRPGQYARLTAQGEALCSAMVTQVGPAETAATGQIVCEITLRPDVELDLPLGALVDAEVVLASARSVPVLPLEAVAEDGTVLWAADGRCWRTDAGVILKNDSLCWVSLPEGEGVVVDGDGLADGQRIREAGA